MKTSSLTLASAVVAACASSVALAQGPDSPTSQTFSPPQKTYLENPGGSTGELATTQRAPAVVTPIHTADDDPQGGAYGIWAAGQDYKVSFHGEPTFIPYLGANYPKTQSLQWTTLGVTAGNTKLMRQGDHAERVHTDTRYEYRYGNVTEAYDVRVEGLEQTFVIGQRPAAGDLVVRGKFTTALVAMSEFAGAHRSIDFADENGQVIANYGKAWVFDASGEKAAIQTSIQDGIVTLTVPNSYLQDAVFPVTIDPLTTPVRINGGAEIIQADVARDDNTNGTSTTYCRSVSATDADCWGWIGPDGLGSLGTFVFSDITTSWSTPDTSVCNVGPSNRYVIAIQRIFSSTSAGIRVWNDSTSASVLKTTVDFITLSGYSSHPDVGGIERFNQSGNFSNGDTACVVMQRDTGAPNTATSDIYAIVLTMDATSSGLTAGSDIGVAVSATRDSEAPSVTKVSGGDPGSGLVDWMVAYQEYNNSISGDDWDAYAERVFSDGTTQGLWFPTVSSGAHKIDVHIEGQRGRYLVTYGRVDQTTLTKITGLQSNQIVNERFDYPVGGSISKQPEVNTSGNLGRIFRVYDVGYDADYDSIWCPVWASPGGTGRVFVERVDFAGDRLELGTVTPDTNQVLSAAGIAFNDDANNFVLAVSEDSGRLLGAEMNHATETSSPTSSGTSCSNVALGWEMRDSFDIRVFNTNSDQQIGSEFAYLTASGASATAVHFMALSPATANFPSVGPVGRGCRTLVDPSSSSFLVLDFRVGANVEWNLKLPAFLSGITVYFQDFHTNAAGNLFLSTQRLEVELAK